MYLTLEVRWFYPGPPPRRLVDWLARTSRLPAAQPPRQDHYLRLDGQPALGIKLREGNLEVKTRLEDPREVALGPRAVGRVARWRKWSFPLAQGTAPEAGGGTTSLERLLVPAPSWIAVDKARRLAAYRVGGGMEAAIVPLGVPLTLGCEFELSCVRAGGEEWWSVCFEAFGQESDLERALRAVTAGVLGHGWPVALDVEFSFGYPAWLDRFAARDDPAKH